MNMTGLGVVLFFVVVPLVLALLIGTIVVVVTLVRHAMRNGGIGRPGEPG